MSIDAIDSAFLNAQAAIHNVAALLEIYDQRDLREIRQAEKEITSAYRRDAIDEPTFTWARRCFASESFRLLDGMAKHAFLYDPWFGPIHHATPVHGATA